MSFFTTAYILETYGMRLNIEQTAHALGMATSTVYNKISAGTFKVPSYVEDGKRWIDHRDLVQYLDVCRARAE